MVTKIFQYLTKTILISVLLQFSQIACKSDSVRKTTDSSKLNLKEEMPIINSRKESFKITIASGGGFTGLYKGYTLHSDGQVVHWQRFGAGQDSILWTAKGATEQIHDFKQQLEDSGLLKQTFQKTGNMTTVVTLELSDTSYTWSWSGASVNDNTPDVLKELYPLVEKYCKNLKK